MSSFLVSGERKKVKILPLYTLYNSHKFNFFVKLLDMSSGQKNILSLKITH